MKAIDWSKLYKKYKGQWVTLANDEITVLSNGATAKEAWEKAQKKGFKMPILNRIPTEIINFSGANQVFTN